MTRLLVLLSVLLGAIAAKAQPFETPAASVLLHDVTSGVSLYEKDADRPVEPASMAKLMTLVVVGRALQAREIGMDTAFQVSEFAWRTGGAPSRTATMFAAVKSRIRVADLLRGIMVQGANDACLILAEGIAGSEAAFVERMNKVAAELGLSGTRFVNATGLPADGQVTTARDLMTLARHFFDRQSRLYPLFSEPEFTWNKIRQTNRNPLIAAKTGVDGMVAGKSDKDGFGAVGAAFRDGRRLILVMHGLPDAAARTTEAKRLLDWGFSSFRTRPLFAAGETVGTVRVFGGTNSTLPVATTARVGLAARTDGEETLTAEIVYRGPVRAPIRAGQPIGTLRLMRDGTVAMSVPVVAATDMDEGGLVGRAFDSIRELAVTLFSTGMVRL